MGIPTLNGFDISGTTTDRPSNIETGQLYYNSTIVGLQVYSGTEWQTAGGGTALSVADEDAMLALTSVTSSQFVERADTGEIWRYLGGGETDLTNWRIQVEVDSFGALNTIFIPRADTTANLDAEAGQVNEITLDTTKGALRKMDGSTAGGRPLTGTIQGAYSNATDIRANLDFDTDTSLEVPGNPRGAFSVDMQTSRQANAEVALGAKSVISGGSGNTTTAGGDGGTIAGGIGGTIAATGGTISGGSGNSIASAGDYATISGGLEATTDNYGQVSHASGKFGTAGDAQRTDYVLRREVELTGSFLPLFLDGASKQMLVSTDTLWAVDVLISGAQSNMDHIFAFSIKGYIVNDDGAMSFVGQTPVELADTLTTIVVEINEDESTNALVVQVKDTGSTDATFRMVAHVRVVEVQFS